METGIGFTEFVRQFSLKPPTIPIVSNFTGSWLTDEEATQAAYWGKHIRQPVLFDHESLKADKISDDVKVFFDDVDRDNGGYIIGFAWIDAEDLEKLGS